MAVIRAKLRRYSFVWLVIIPASLVVVIVNPLREMALEDDWAYSLTVRHLLETGNYQLNSWLAANMPFQAYWGLLFSKVIGYSHSTLRMSTLILAFFGLIGFFFLAKEHKLGPLQSGVLTLSLLASPLFLKFSFTFNTDIPFLSCLILALLCYSRALRLRSTWWMLTGSLAATCAILTRQLGVALPIGLLVMWLLDKERRSRLGYYVCGLALPLFATGWQAYAGVATPNWAAQYVKVQQQAYILNALASPLSTIIANVWRVISVFHYLALFTLPLLILVVFDLLGRARRNQERRENSNKLSRTLRIIEFIVIIGIIGSTVLSGFYNRFMPYLPWSFDVTPVHGIDVLVTILTTTGIIGFVHILFQSVKLSANEVQSKLFLEIVTICLVIFLMFFFQIGDQYLLVLLPFTLIIIGQYLQYQLTHWATILLLIAFLSVSLMWTRGQLTRVEAIWKASNAIEEMGIGNTNIYGDWIWNAYQGVFDRYISDEGQRYSLNSFFADWLPQQKAMAQYWIVTDLDSPPSENWEVVVRVPFQDSFFREQTVYGVKRSSRCGGGSSCP